eukprot:g5838.t1
MDRYRVDKVVGKGSFGQAVLCSRIADGKACIVKQVDTSKLPSKARREASKEATLLAKLSHPNIVGFWESFFDGPSRDVLCIVMDYADGGDLSSCLRRRNGRLLDEEVVLDWFVQTTLALKHIHDRKILHRDLKTQNIFLTRSRVVKLGDFGIAKVLGSTLDLARTCIGTPYYMSPEICQEKRYNHKSDMWSLGCVLYEITCLRHAFEGTNMRLLVMKICSQEPRPISARYSSGVRSLIAQLLKKDPHARPSTGAVLRRPLIKDKIGRFLSEAQIKEEFSNGVSPGRQPSSSAAAAVPSPPPGAGSAAPRWPFNPAGISRPRPDAASPGQAGRGRDGNNGGRGIAAGEGGGRSPQASRAGDGRRRAAEEADERRRAEASARKREFRAAAKVRGQLAAVALNIAKPSSRADRRSAAPKRPSSAEDAAAAARRRRQREARPPEDRTPDSKPRERAEAARAALGIGGGRKPSPRRASQHDGNENDQAPPRRPSALSPVAAGADSVARGGRDERKVFHRLRNVRGGGGGGSPTGGGDVQQPRRPGGDGRLGEGGRGALAAGVAGAGSMRMEMDEALDLARRRRAARAVFGLGFGAPDGDDDDEDKASSPRRVEAGDGRSGLEAKRSGPDRSNPGAEDPTAGPDRRAAAKLPAEKGEGSPPPPPEPRQATDHQQQRPQRQQQHQQQQQEEEDEDEDEEEEGEDHDRRGEEPAAADTGDEKSDVDLKHGMVPSDEEDVNENSHRRWLGQAQHQQEEAVPETVAEDSIPGTIPPRAEQKGSSDDEEEKAGLSGREEIAQDVGGGADGDAPSDVVGSGAGSEAADGGGDSEVRSKIDLGVTDGWFQKFEAKMGAIKKQVGGIKSPPLSTPQRSGGDRHRHPGSRRNEINAAPLSFRTPPPRVYSDNPSGMVAGGKGGEGKTEWLVDDGPPTPAAQCLPSRPPEEEEEKKQTAESQAESDRRQGQEERDDDTRISGGSNSPEASGAAGFADAGAVEPGAARRRLNSQQTGKLSAAAAAIEAAAAAVAAIPVISSDNARTPEPSGYSSDEQDDDGADNPVERPGGGGSESSRATPAPVGIAGGVKVAMTPAQRGSGGRVARKAALSSRSERKPPRHADALAAELERHSERRPQRKPGTGAGHPSGGKEGSGGSNAYTPSAEERGQALRAARDRERAQLRALIAQKRRKPANKLKDGAGGGAGGKESLDGGARRGELFEPLLEWSSPRNGVAAVGARSPATDPPPRRSERLRRSPPHRLVAPGVKAGGVDGAGSVDAYRRRRRPRSNNHGSSGSNTGSRQDDGRAGGVGAHKDPANRNQSLRDFIAESRRNRRSRQSQNLGDEDDVSVVVAAASGPGKRVHGLLPPEAADQESDWPVSENGEQPADAVGPRRNIGQEFDEEDRARGESGGEGGGEPGNRQGRRRGRGASGGKQAPTGGIPERAEGGSVEGERGERGQGTVDGGSCPSSRSPSSSPRRGQLEENDAGDGEGVGEMEGVHPGLATYDSQRSAAGMDGEGRAGQEEYARMLELMQKEVLELGDGASTDSGWGGSASSSAEEKRSGSERDGDDDDERSTSSSSGGGGGGSCYSTGRRDDSPIVSGPELAVFLFQGGVPGDADSALEAKDDSSSSDRSAVAKGRAAQQSPYLVPPSEDAFFEYSGSGGERSSGNARGVLRTGGLGSSSTIGKAATGESGDPLAMSGEAEPTVGAPSAAVVGSAMVGPTVVTRGAMLSTAAAARRATATATATARRAPVHCDSLLSVALAVVVVGWFVVGVHSTLGRESVGVVGSAVVTRRAVLSAAAEASPVHHRFILYVALPIVVVGWFVVWVHSTTRRGARGAVGASVVLRSVGVVEGLHVVLVLVAVAAGSVERSAGTVGRTHAFSATAVSTSTGRTTLLATPPTPGPADVAVEGDTPGAEESLAVDESELDEAVRMHAEGEKKRLGFAGPKLDAGGSQGRVNGVLAVFGLKVVLALGVVAIAAAVGATDVGAAAVGVAAVRGIAGVLFLPLLLLLFHRGLAAAAAAAAAQRIVRHGSLRLQMLPRSKTLSHETSRAELQQGHGLLETPGCDGRDAVVVAKNINNNNNINTMNNNTMSNSSNDISSTIEPTMIKERQGETSRPGLQLYKSAARNLRDYHGVPSITAGGLEKTMALLQLRPARLVAQGLAPRKHLKAEAAMPDNSLGSSSRSSSSKSAVEEEKKEGEKENTGDASDCGDTNSSGTNISGTNSSSDDNDTESKHDLETEDRKHPVHAALAAAGIKLRPGEAKPLLLALGVHPHRLVKLGLVDREALLSSRRAALGRDIGRTRGGGRDQQCGPPRRRAHRGGGEGAGAPAADTAVTTTARTCTAAVGAKAGKTRECAGNLVITAVPAIMEKERATADATTNAV